MAYTQTTPVVTRRDIDGHRYYFVSFSETECAPADQWSVSGLPYIGAIIHYKATLTAGTGMTIAPSLGRAPTFTVGTKDVNTQDSVGDLSPAAVSFDDAGPLVYHSAVQALADDTVTIYGYSTPNNPAADHTIYTEFVVIEGLGT